MDKLKPYVIGVDLGGTNTVFGVVNARGEVVAENSIKTQQYKTAEEFVEAGVACMKPLLEQIGGADQVQGMGMTLRAIADDSDGLTRQLLEVTILLIKNSVHFPYLLINSLLFEWKIRHAPG